MTRDLTSLSLAQLIALGFQNKIPMKSRPTKMSYAAFLSRELNNLEVIEGLETKENGQ